MVNQMNKIEFDKIWITICKAQYDLHIKYGPIEEKSGLGTAILEGKPFHIDSPQSQYVLKDFFWRVTEELGEFHEAHEAFHYNGPSTFETSDHAKEELIDTLHFLVEIYVFMDRPLPLATMYEGRLAWETMQHNKELKTHPCDWAGPVASLTMAGNCLKQKPWKQTHMETDQVKFHKHLDTAVDWLLYMLYNHVGDDAMILEAYLDKNAINQFRQRSEY